MAKGGQGFRRNGDQSASAGRPQRVGRSGRLAEVEGGKSEGVKSKVQQRKEKLYLCADVKRRQRTANQVKAAGTP